MQGSSPPVRERPAWPLALDAAPPAWPRGTLFGSERQGVLRPARAVRRLVMILLWTLFAVVVQSVCILLPGRPKVVFARIYWSVFCRIIGLGVQVAGQPIPGAHGGSRRPVVFVSNHSSWLDVPVLGGRLEACFISKDDVARWPLVEHHRAAGADGVHQPPAHHHRSRARRDDRAAGRGRQPDPVPRGHHLGRLARAAVPLGVLRHRRGATRAAADPAGLGGLRPARRAAGRGGPAGRCSPGTATWTSPRISGGWRSIAGCGRRCCCTRRSIPRASPIARRWLTRSGRPSPMAPRACGRTGRRGRSTPRRSGDGRGGRRAYA